jgi:hypothetical protein
MVLMKFDSGEILGRLKNVSLTTALHLMRQLGGAVDNFRRGLYSYFGASAETSLGVCLTELKH